MPGSWSLRSLRPAEGSCVHPVEALSILDLQGNVGLPCCMVNICSDDGEMGPGGPSLLEQCVCCHHVPATWVPGPAAKIALSGDRPTCCWPFKMCGCHTLPHMCSSPALTVPHWGHLLTRAPCLSSGFSPLGTGTVYLLLSSE